MINYFTRKAEYSWFSKKSAKVVINGINFFSEKPEDDNSVIRINLLGEWIEKQKIIGVIIRKLARGRAFMGRSDSFYAGFSGKFSFGGVMWTSEIPQNDKDVEDINKILKELEEIK